MLQVKTNFKGKYTNMTCRGCGINIETQAHVLSTCPKLHQNNTTKVYLSDIFNNNNPTLLATIADNIEKTITKINTPNTLSVVTSEISIS